MEDVWYSGVRVAECRKFTPNDRVALDTLRRGRKTKLVASLTVPLAVILCGCLLGLVFGRPELIGGAVPIAIIITLGRRPWRIVPACVRQLEALNRDDARAEVYVCNGFGGDLIFALNEERRLMPEVLVQGRRDEPLTIELLPDSGALLTVNGLPVSWWNETQKGTTATKSVHAVAAANFVQRQLSDGTLAGERALSGEELNELLRHAPPLSLLDLLLFVFVTIVAIAAWGNAIATKSTTLLLPVMASLLAIWLAGRTIRQWTIHRRFARDIENGAVIILRAQQDGIPHGPAYEYLSGSGRLWSVDQDPVTWRRLPLIRRTFVRRRRAS